MQSVKVELGERNKGGFPKQLQRAKYNLLLNERLKAARKRKGLTVSAVVRGLAEKGVSMGHSTIRGYEIEEESINHRYPSLPMLIELADFYGCSLDYLFGKTDRFKPQTSTKEFDLLDLLESRRSVTFKGEKLNRQQRERIIGELDILLSKLV